MKESVTLKFHITRKARKSYRLGEELFTIPWKVVFPDYQMIYELANRINERRNLEQHPELTVKVGQLRAAGLLNEIFHYVTGLYGQQVNPEAFKRGLEWVAGQDTPLDVKRTLSCFVNLFPPLSKPLEERSTTDSTEDAAPTGYNEQMASREILLLHLAKENPAFSPFHEFIDDTEFEKKVHYGNFISSLEEFFKSQLPFGPKNNFLIDMLREPVVASPLSLNGQIDYIRENWTSLLPPELVYRLLLVQDIIKEEEKFGLLGPGPALVPTFGRGMYEYAEPELFTSDRDWMPKVVLMAKVIHVWLDQLSRKYQRSITRLDQIPDKELDTLAQWGFTGLWLIGIWERSPASQMIKQISGNAEALASSYSLYDYKIAEILGGDQALENLRYRAWQRGIRLACDMVPNHMGIYSRWILEHPDWFLQLDFPPYPSYRFTGQNLSLDPRIGLYLEDGYWDRRDAAIVFQYVDHETDEVRYIYHGNDGTRMPWNDTAQLNYLRQDVREAVIQLILHIASKFPIIRFDAAMTLTKKHYQRLWFPQPGTGGDIPSRSGRGLSREEFDAAFPREFWREVVDRVTAEGQDTLLIAEAFWLMEGFFVRTLGMHRVYNSAFMNMLKMEENAKYRSVLKNVLEFNPEILKRFVNFMNNPDEETAVAQFGKGDKYFGIAIMMVTLPGLPMFGHGQVEGFVEKYGMEYGKAYWNEEVDGNLVHRHVAEVFPLLRKRHLFSGVENFFLFDFFDRDGKVTENVFAYSNRYGEERALVLYNNKYDLARGWIRLSAASSVEGDKPGERYLIQKTLTEALGLATDEGHFIIYKDFKSGLEYIRSGRGIAETGFYVELDAYQYYVFSDFREVRDTPEGYYSQLAESMAGRGVPSLEEAYREMILAPVLKPFKQVLDQDMLRRLTEVYFQGPKTGGTPRQALRFFEERMEVLLKEMSIFAETMDNVRSILDYLLELMGLIQQLETFGTSFSWKGPRGKEYKASINYLLSQIPVEYTTDLPFYRVLYSWIATYRLGMLKGQVGYELQSAAWFDEWGLGKIITQTFRNLGCDEELVRSETLLVRILTEYHACLRLASSQEIYSTFRNMLDQRDVQAYLRFNWYEGVQWFSKEALESLVYWLFVVSVLTRSLDDSLDTDSVPSDIVKMYRITREVIQAAKKAGYKVENFKFE